MMRLARCWMRTRQTMRRYQAALQRYAPEWRHCSAGSMKKARYAACTHQERGCYDICHWHHSMVAAEPGLLSWSGVERVFKCSLSLFPFLTADAEAQPGVVHRCIAAPDEDKPADGNGSGQWLAGGRGWQRQAKSCTPCCLHQRGYHFPDNCHKGEQSMYANLVPRQLLGLCCYVCGLPCMPNGGPQGEDDISEGQHWAVCLPQLAACRLFAV